MSTYGRNFEFRVQPQGGQRAARYVLPVDADGTLPLGAPVRVDTVTGTNDDGRLPVELAVGDSPNPQSGLAGIAIYEWAPNAFAGSDPLLTLYSDRDFVPLGGAVYLASGDQVKVVLRNTAENNFFGQRVYPGRTMVAGVGIATPTVVVGDMLVPHSNPSDDNGYWEETNDADAAWLVVTHVDNSLGEVEARFLF